ncbi:hypothetical protein Tco_1428951 [Tanacetum coccineum]
MDDPNITMEEYIRLEEEKAQKCGKVFNWETAKYSKIWYDEEIHDLRSVETEFPAIAFNDQISSKKTLSCEPTVSSLNDEIDIKISFDDSDDEDYTVIFDKNSFSYKIISTNDLKMDSENDNEKVNMPSLPPPEPTVSYFDDLDFFNDFENEFPAIVYNDAQSSKSDLLTEPILSSQHIDEFDLNDETSLSEYDEVEQNVLYFNDLLPFNIIHPNDLKLEKDNDDNEVDIIQSSRGNEITQGNDCGGQDMTPLPPCDQRHLWLRYQVEGYTKEIVHDFEQRLETIFGRQVNRVYILDFEELTPDMRQDLAERMRMVYTGDDGQEDQRRDGFRCGWHSMFLVGREFLRGVPSYTYIRDPVRRLCHKLISYSISERGQEPKKVTATDLFYLRSMDRGAAKVLYMLAQYIFRHVEGRKSGARLSGGHFIGRLAHHFGLVSDDRLRGLSVVAPPGPERQQDVAPGAPKAVVDAPAINDGGVTTRCQDFTGTYGEINDRSAEILHMDDFMYDTAHGGYRADISGIRWDLSGELTCRIPETHQAEDWQGHHFHRPTAARPMTPYPYLLIKPGRPRERNIDEYWWRIYKSGDLEVLES